MSLPAQPAKARVTVWTGKGPAAAYDHPKTQALLKSAQPQIITLHGDPLALASDAGRRLTDRVRKEQPASEVWWGVQGDSYGPDPSRQWVKCASAAQALHVACVEWNCETKWSKKVRPFGHARPALLAAKAEAPSVVFGFTSFDGPVSIPVGLGRWGYGESFDWRGFLGAGSPVAWAAPQVYSAWGKRTLGQLVMMPATRVGLLGRYDRHQRSWAVAQHRGLIAPTVATHIYLQSHHSDLAALVTLAQTAPVAAFWCAPGGLDAAGATAIRVVAELHRRRQTVRQFQASAGLAADGLVGRLTLGALGISPA